MEKHSSSLLNWLIGMFVILGIGWFTWKTGISFNWSWGDFWSNFISNAGSSAVIGLILYWIITRPDEKKARQERKNQALAIPKIELEINLECTRLYGGALKRTSSDLSTLYPL